MRNVRSWLGSPLYDSLFILLTPLYCLLAIWMFPEIFSENVVSPVSWLVLVLLVDVAHVYSTLYRTYFQCSAREKFKSLFYLVPVLAWLAGILLYQAGALTFWRVVAYLALFHFIRQQYGFFQLYARVEVRDKWERRIDALAIYSATLYPVLFWHFEGNRQFSWFMQGDFMLKLWPEVLPYLGIAYLLILCCYVVKEIRRSWKNGANLPKNLLLLGTAFAWYAGIVWFNGDLTFTLFNVITHGIPYIALVWLYKEKEKKGKPARQRMSLLVIFLLSIAAFAYLEEGLWDGLVWQEHASLFPYFQSLASYASPLALSMLVPLLAVPQLTHYILDGFIWRRNR